VLTVAGQAVTVLQAVSFIQNVLRAVAATVTAKGAWKEVILAEDKLVVADGDTVTTIRDAIAAIASDLGWYLGSAAKYPAARLVDGHEVVEPGRTCAGFCEKEWAFERRVPRAEKAERQQIAVHALASQRPDDMHLARGRREHGPADRLRQTGHASVSLLEDAESFDDRNRKPCVRPRHAFDEEIIGDEAHLLPARPEPRQRRRVVVHAAEQRPLHPQLDARREEPSYRSLREGRLELPWVERVKHEHDTLHVPQLRKKREKLVRIRRIDEA
jgi:hypothetical protein